MTLSELPARKQITLGGLDFFTGCSEMCWSSQPASVNIFSVTSRCLLSPAYLRGRTSTISRETKLNRTVSAVATIEACSNSTLVAAAQSFGRNITSGICPAKHRATDRNDFDENRSVEVSSVYQHH